MLRYFNVHNKTGKNGNAHNKNDSSNCENDEDEHDDGHPIKYITLSDGSLGNWDEGTSTISWEHNPMHSLQNETKK